MDNSIPLKKCYRCEQSFPATAEFFKRHRKGKDGFNASCKSCCNPDVTKRPPLPGHDKARECSTCHGIFPATKEFFEARKDSKDGMRKQCKKCQEKNGIPGARNQSRLPDYPGHIEIPEGVPARQCLRCEHAFPATTEYFYKASGTKSPSSQLSSRCKWCLLRNEEERPPAPIKDRNMKKCCRCKKVLPATEEFFGLRKSRAVRTTRKAGFLSHCRQCHNEKKKRYYYKYKEEMGEFWTNRHREWVENNRERNRDTYRNWCKANHERAKAISHKRRARKMNAQGTYTGEDIKIQYRRQKGRCYWCKQKFSKSKAEKAPHGYHIDHYIPLARGGTNGPDNIVLACPFCNSSRKDRLPNEWKRANRLF